VVGPGVITNWPDALENHRWRASIERKSPQSLSGVTLHAHDGNGAPTLDGRRRIFAFRRGRGNAGRPPRGNVVPVDVRLRISPDGGEQHGSPVAREAWLVV